MTQITVRLGHMKPFRLSAHAVRRSVQRGASEQEIAHVLATATRETADRGLWRAHGTFSSPTRSPVNGTMYNQKAVEIIFADEPDGITVVTVKVYYADREAQDED